MIKLFEESYRISDWEIGAIQIRWDCRRSFCRKMEEWFELHGQKQKKKLRRGLRTKTCNTSSQGIIYREKINWSVITRTRCTSFTRTLVDSVAIEERFFSDLNRSSRRGKIVSVIEVTAISENRWSLFALAKGLYCFLLKRDKYYLFAREKCTCCS